MEHIARQVADRDTNAYIARKGITPWQVANEPAIQNEIDQVWNEYLCEARFELAQGEEVTHDAGN